VALSGEKTQKLWLWKVLDSVTGQLLEWECGDRSARTLKRLYARIKDWNVEFFCTDELAAYAKILPPERLVMSKALTIGIEQNNSRQRHWFARFRRKSIVVSKSKEMVDLTLFLFAAYHVNSSIHLPSVFT
jgi:insertion element IS1 protein InsB